MEKQAYLQNYYSVLNFEEINIFLIAIGRKKYTEINCISPMRVFIKKIKTRL